LATKLAASSTDASDNVTPVPSTPKRKTTSGGGVKAKTPRKKVDTTAAEVSHGEDTDGAGKVDEGMEKGKGKTVKNA